MLKIIQKSGKLRIRPTFRTISNVFAKMTVIAKSAKPHPAAKKCFGLEEPSIYAINS